MQFIKNLWDGVKSLVSQAVDKTLAVTATVGTALATSLGLTQDAHAAAPDFTTLTAAVDWSTAGAAILLVCAGLAGVYILSGGASLILGKISSKGKS